MMLAMMMAAAPAFADDPYVLRGGAFNGDLDSAVIVERVRDWAVQELYDVQDPVTMSLSDREFISRVVIPFVPSSILGSQGMIGSLSCMVRVTVESTGAAIQLGPCQHRPEIALAGGSFRVPRLNEFGVVTSSGYPTDLACQNMVSRMKKCRSKWHLSRMRDMQARIQDRWSTMLPSLRRMFEVAI
jgi:hypothetical protein